MKNQELPVPSQVILAAKGTTANTVYAPINITFNAENPKPPILPLKEILKITGLVLIIILAVLVVKFPQLCDFVTELLKTWH